MHLFNLPAICLVAFLAQTCLCLTGNFTFLENYNHDGLTISPLDGLVEIKPNATDIWRIEPIPPDRGSHIIRHPKTNQFIYFRQTEDGTTATLSKNAATVITIAANNPYHCLLYGLRLRSSSGSPYYCTMEANSNTDPRQVLRLYQKRPAVDFAFLPEAFGRK